MIKRKPVPVLDNENGTKRRSLRPSTVIMRAHSNSPAAAAARAQSPVGTKKLVGERRCQSLSPLNHLPKQTLQESPTRLLDKQSASVPATTNVLNIDKQNEEKPQKELPQFVVSKMTRALAAKKREFFKSRKALIAQQNALLEQYAGLKELETKIGANGEEGIGEMRVLSVTDWPAHDLLLLIKNDLELPASSEISGIFGPQVVQQLQNVLCAIPAEFNNLATELMARRIDILTLLRNKLGIDRSPSAYIPPEVKTRNLRFDQETEHLHAKVTEIVENVKSKINYALEMAMIPWLDREDMSKKIERLQKDNLILQNKYFSSDEPKKDTDKEKCNADRCPPFQAVCEELQKERSAKEALKGTVSTAEYMLRVARARIATLERQLTDARAQYDAAIRKQKDMEQHIRLRESSFDARTKKLQATATSVSKASEETISALMRQRDALELRVRELQELVEQRELGSEEKQARERSRADSLQAKVALQEKDIDAARKRVEDLQKLAREVEEKHRVLQEHSVKLVEVEKKRCLEYLPTKENEPTVRETDIWKDLQVTRMALAKAEEELRNSRADKDSFLNSLSKIAQGEGPDSLEEKMSIELLEKERTICKLKMILDEYQENEKIMERSMAEYENELADLKLEVKRLRNYDCFSKDVKFQDLQTELLDLHMKVSSLSRERSALVSAAASRALMLERHERAAELFASVTRARREVAALVDGTTEPPPMDEAIYAEISRSLTSVCSSAADTWSALRAERARVLRLERAVLSQSLQLEREGRARSRLECRRAQLERDLVLRAQAGPDCSDPTEPTLLLKLPNSVNYRGQRYLITGS